MSDPVEKFVVERPDLNSVKNHPAYLAFQDGRPVWTPRRSEATEFASAEDAQALVARVGENSVVVSAKIIGFVIEIPEGGGIAPLYFAPIGTAPLWSTDRTRARVYQTEYEADAVLVSGPASRQSAMVVPL